MRRKFLLLLETGLVLAGLLLGASAWKIYSALQQPLNITQAELALVMGVAPEHFLVENVPAFDISTMWRVLVIAILCAVASMLFCWAMHSGTGSKACWPRRSLRTSPGRYWAIRS